MNQERITRAPPYTPSEFTINFKEGRSGGKYADYDDEIRYITNVVGSKSKKDITRKNAFMSKAAFKVWNEKRGNKYSIDDEKLDEDEIPELVVRNPKGKLIAVNGYTVKRSDWGVRKPFYTEYPTRQDRRGKSLGNYVREKIYETTDDDFDEFGYANSDYLARIKSIQSKPEYAGYSMKASTPSSYNLFLSHIIKPAVNRVISIITGNNPALRKDLQILCDADYGKGWMMQFAGQLWSDWIKTPILKALGNNLGTYLSKYNENHINKVSDVNDEKFVKWIMNKSEIKSRVIDGFKHIMSNKTAYINAAIEYYEPFLRESAGKSESFENTEIQPEDVDESDGQLSY